MSRKFSLPEPKAVFTPQERAFYALNKQLDKYQDNPTKEDLKQELRWTALAGPETSWSKDPVEEAFSKGWRTGNLDSKNFIHDFTKGKLKVTDGKRKVRVENYASGYANEEVGGAVDYSDVELLCSKAKYRAKENELKAAFVPVAEKDSVYRYKGGLSEELVKDLAKIAAFREFEEEIGLSLGSFIEDKRIVYEFKTTKYGTKHVFTLKLSPAEYTELIEKPLDTKKGLEHLNQSETSKIWWNKYLKYKSKYLKLKKKFSHVF